MILPRELDIPCVRDVVCNEASMVNAGHRIARAVDDQGWYADGGKDRSDVDLPCRFYDGPDHRRACRGALE